MCEVASAPPPVSLGFDGEGSAVISLRVSCTGGGSPETPRAETASMQLSEASAKHFRLIDRSIFVVLGRADRKTRLEAAMIGC